MEHHARVDSPGNRQRTLELLAAAVLLLAPAGCASETPTPQAPSKPVDSAKLVITPGYGVPECHIGMRVEDLSQDWVESNVLFPDLYKKNTAERARYYNVEMGAFIECRKWKVYTVNFVYLRELSSYANFKGSTKHGIQESSTMEDVLRVHGEPESISHVKRTRTQRMSTDLVYLKKGVSFLFESSKLGMISVHAPQEPPYESWLVEDIGDTAALRELSLELSLEEQEEETE